MPKLLAIAIKKFLYLVMPMLFKLIIVALCLISIPIVSVSVALLTNDLPWTDPPGLVTRLRHYLTTNVAETAKTSSYPELVMREYDYPTDDFFSLLEISATKFPSLNNDGCKALILKEILLLSGIL